MKVVFAILITLNVIFLRAQNEVTSFYFLDPQPSETSLENKFEKTICGRYLFEDDTLVSLIITPDSIYTHFGTFTYVTRKEIKKSDKYRIENDLLFGIKEGEGIPFKEKNDTVYTLITQNDLIFKPDKNHQLYKVENNYFLNYKEENGYYSTQILSLENNSVVFYSLDHEVVLDEILDFISTKTKKVDGFKTYLSSPEKSEFISFVENEGFKDRVMYINPENL